MEFRSGAVRIASYKQKLPRKAKNIYLPTEVWVDVFCYPWISRPGMGSIVDKIGNRWFGDQLQFYLHEWGKHTLGEVYFTHQGVLINYHNGQYQQLEYPQTAMPENIRFCESFLINHFDNRVFNFFRRIQNVLTADTKLDVRFIREEKVGDAHTILRHLLPFIDGLHTLRTDDRMLPIVKTSMQGKFHSVKMFDVYLNGLAAIQPIMEWLSTSSDEPKILKLCCGRKEYAQQTLETIRRQFMEATEPSTFAVVIRTHFDLPAFNCGNAIGEQLCGTGKELWEFYVFRHQANTETGEKLRQWVDGNMDKKGEYYWKQCITLSNPTIGDGRIFDLPEDDERPSTSNK